MQDFGSTQGAAQRPACGEPRGRLVSGKIRSWGREIGRGPGRHSDGSQERGRTGSQSEEVLWLRDLQG